MAGKEPSKSKTSVKFFILVGIVIGCWLFGRMFRADLQSYRDILSGYPVILSGIIFVLLYVVTTTFIWFGPKDILRVSAALFYGAWISTVFILIAEMINAAILFHLSRFLGRDYVEENFHLRAKDIEKAKEHQGFIGVLALRLNPLIPIRFLDLGYGLTRIRFSKYFIVCILASLPRFFWLQYILAEVGDLILQDYGSMNFALLYEYLNNFILDNPLLILYSVGYFLIVVILTIVAGVIKIKHMSKQTSR